MTVLLLFAGLTTAGAAAAQDLDYYRRVLSSDNREAKRTVLLEIRNLHDETASRVALQALTDRDEMVRAMAVAAVLDLPSSEAAASIRPLLSDRSAFVRMSAAYALGAAADPAAVAPLIERLQRDSDKAVRGAAAVSLGKIGDPAGLGPLTAELQRKPSEDNGFIRRSAARSIGQIAERLKASGQPAPQTSAVQTLIKVLNSSRETDDTHREAAFALGRLGDQAAVPALRSHLNSPDPYLVEQCRISLDIIGR